MSVVQCKTESTSSMEPEPEVNEDSKPQDELDTSLPEVKAEPLDYEDGDSIRAIPEWYYPAVDIKTELPEEEKEDNNPEVILPDWSYLYPESASEAEGEEDPIDTDSMKREHFRKNIVDKKHLSLGEDEAADISIETEDFALKEEPGDLPLFVGVEEGTEQIGRGKSSEATSDPRTCSSQAGDENALQSTKDGTVPYDESNQTIIIKLKQFECQQCGKRFSENSGMKKHVRTVHLKLKKFECQHCGQRFGQSSSMNQHVRTVHLQMKLFECPYCGQKFGQSSSMKKHAHNVHLHKKLFECHHCGQTFGRSSSLKHHLNTAHPMEKHFECQQCGKKFSESGSMRKHVRTVHLKMKPSECLHCGKRFSQNNTMKKHVETVHLKLKQFKCQHCGKMFSEKGSVRKHVRIVHLKKKPFQCQFCDQKFGESCYMKQHIQTVHLKEKQYECQLCGHKFGYSYNLKKHMRNTHSKDLSNCTMNKNQSCEGNSQCILEIK